MLISYLCESRPWTQPVARCCRSGSECTSRCLLTWPCWAVTSHNIDQSDQSSRSLRRGTRCNHNYSWKHQANKIRICSKYRQMSLLQWNTIFLFELVQKYYNTTSDKWQLRISTLFHTTVNKEEHYTYFWWVSMLKFSSNSTCTVSVAGASIVHTQSTLWG